MTNPLDEMLSAKTETNPFDEVLEKKVPKKSYALSEVPGKALETFPSGMWDYIKTFFDPQTYKNLAKLADILGPYKVTESGYFQKNPIPKEVMGSISKSLYDQFGTYENIKRTAAEKPQEFLGMLSTIVSGLGGVTGISKVATVGKALEPLNVAMMPLKGAKLAMKGKVGNIAERLYTSALPISSKLEIEQIHRTAQRGLDLGIFSTEKGLERLKQNMNQVGMRIDNAISKGQRTGEAIDTWKVADSLDQLQDLFGSKLFYDPELPKIIDDMKQALLDLHGEKIPIETAQTIKRTTQRFLDKAYDRLSAIKIEGEKIANSKIRTELEELHPELKTLNPTQQENVWLKKTIEEAIKRQAKAKMAPGISFFNVLKNKTIDDPILKEKLAIILNKIKNRPIYPSKTTYPRLAIQQSQRIQMEE